ncbi:MAG: DUF2784 domain-containing protein [Limisphaerales bacterium]
MSAKFYLILADLILLVHFSFVAFIVLGFVVIWTGYVLGWGFVRNFRFRMAHLVAMGFVAAESLVGMVCPLTEWENNLRVRGGGGAKYEASFIEHWLGGVLFYEMSEGMFMAIYCGFFALVLVTYWVVRPRRLKARGS